MTTKSEQEAFFAAVSSRATQERKDVKSAAIIEFIRKNWKLFCPYRIDMEQAVGQLGMTYDYTVDSLCNQLGIHENVFFKRTKPADTSIALLRFDKSPLFELFLGCCEKVTSAECLLFAVAGVHSLVITNMQTDYVEGRMHMFYKSKGILPDIHIFKVEDAPDRLPTLFKHI